MVSPSTEPYPSFHGDHPRRIHVSDHASFHHRDGEVYWLGSYPPPDVILNGDASRYPVWVGSSAYPRSNTVPYLRNVQPVTPRKSQSLSSNFPRMSRSVPDNAENNTNTYPTHHSRFTPNFTSTMNPLPPSEFHDPHEPHYHPLEQSPIKPPHVQSSLQNHALSPYTGRLLPNTPYNHDGNVVLYNGFPPSNYMSMTQARVQRGYPHRRIHPKHDFGYPLQGSHSTGRIQPTNQTQLSHDLPNGHVPRLGRSLSESRDQPVREFPSAHSPHRVSSGGLSNGYVRGISESPSSGIGSQSNGFPGHQSSFTNKHPNMSGSSLNTQQEYDLNDSSLPYRDRWIKPRAYPNPRSTYTPPGEKYEFTPIKNTEYKSPSSRERLYTGRRSRHPSDQRSQKLLEEFHQFREKQKRRLQMSKNTTTMDSELL